MKIDFSINVSRSEAMRRYLLGSALIGAVLLSPAVPSWIALFACYPIFTAMIQWDPANAILQSVVNKSSKSVQEAIFRKTSAV
ncbi:YgaP-like transmembrane domain [Kaarinaea lacus]